MNPNNITIPVISEEVKEVLSELQQRNGVAELYVTVLNSLFNKVLYHQDDMELNDHDTISILRSLRMLLDDICKLSRIDVNQNKEEVRSDEEAEQEEE